MRKLFIIFLFMVFCSCNIVCAEDGDLWDNFGDTNVYNQKPVSDKEFEQALESKKGKQKRNKNIPKGESYRESNETDFIRNMPSELPVLSIPVNLFVSEDTIVPVGHYQIEGKMTDGKPVLNLYQAHYVIARIPAVETDDDFNQKAINFVKIMEHNNRQIKIIFGCVDFNAYSIIDITE